MSARGPVLGVAQVKQHLPYIGVPAPAAGTPAPRLLASIGALQSRPMTRAEAQRALGLKGEANFRKLYLLPALEAGLIEMTIPDKPTSRLQKYRLTDKRRTVLARKRKGAK